MEHTSFDTLWPQVDPIPGWLTQDQARVLFSAAQQAPTAAPIVEIGSHRGRSTVVLAGGGGGRQVVAIDPFVTGRLFDGDAARRDFEAALARTGLSDRVELKAARSQDVYARWNLPIGLLYIDGKHDYWSCLRDLRWARFLAPGGQVLVHDAFSSIGVTTALIRHLATDRTLRYAGRTGSLASFILAPPTASSTRAFLGELPWWMRNVGIKVLLRLRARGVAARLGHTDRFDPY